MSTKQRYFIDERVGCIAVRDRQHPEFDPDYYGLHSYTPDVVWYAHGCRVGGTWRVDDRDIERAYAELKRLEEEATPAPYMLQVLQAFKPHAEKYLSGKVHDPAVAMWADEHTEQLFTNLLNVLKTATV